MSHRTSALIAAVLSLFFGAASADASQIPFSPGASQAPQAAGAPSALSRSTRTQAPEPRRIVVTADVTSARLAPREGIWTHVSLRLLGNRHGAPERLTYTLIGGRKNGMTLTPSLWPLWAKGMRVRLTLTHKSGRWSFAEAERISARGAWTESTSSNRRWAIDELPLVLHPEPGTPDWVTRAFAVGAAAWSDDSGSWAEVSVGGTSAATAPGPLANCVDGATESTIAMRNLRSLSPPGSSWVGLAYSCSSGTTKTSHLFIDPTMVSDPVNSQQTATHEIGHALGLGHSEYSWAVMFWKVNNTSELNSDDRAGLNALYPGPYAATLSSPQAVWGTVTLRANPGATVSVPVNMRVAGDGVCNPNQMLASALAGGHLLADAPGFATASASAPWQSSTGRTCQSTIRLRIPNDASGKVSLSLAAAAFGRASYESLSVDVQINPAPTLRIRSEASSSSPGVHYLEAWYRDEDDSSTSPRRAVLDWDLNADGRFGDSAEVWRQDDDFYERYQAIKATFPTPGPQVVSARVTDIEGLSTTARVVVEGAPAKLPTPPGPTPPKPPYDPTPTTPTTPTTPPVLTNAIVDECLSQETQLATWTSKAKVRKARMKRSAAASARRPSSSARKRRAAADRRSWSSAVKQRSRARAALNACLKP